MPHLTYDSTRTGKITTFPIESRAAPPSTAFLPIPSHPSHTHPYDLPSPPPLSPSWRFFYDVYLIEDQLYSGVKNGDDKNKSRSDMNNILHLIPVFMVQLWLLCECQQSVKESINKKLNMA